jgi:predicted outer membrane repeat protein
MLRKSLRGIIVTAAIAVLTATTADVARTDVTFTLGQPTVSQHWGKGRPTCLVFNKRTGLGSRSLQAAIDAAVGGDTLLVMGTCVGTSTAAKDLTIRGRGNPAFGVATLDGDHLGSVLSVTGGVTVAISRLIVTNGNGVNGGGIANSGGSTVVLRRSIVTGNTGQNGGGISNSGNSTFVVQNSVVDRNTAGTSGGGIFSENGSTLTLKNSIVSRNVARVPGGGIFSFNGGGGVVTLTNSLVIRNSAELGGGIAFIFGTVSLIDSIVIGNTASRNGGGVFDTVGTFSLVGSSIVIANTAGLDGGGIYNSGGTLINCISGVNVTANSPNNIFP